MQLKTVSGKMLHPIGVGTWTIGSRKNYDTGVIDAVHGNEEKEIKAIRYSIQKGQNHITSAEVYGAGHTDEIVGQAIAAYDRKNIYLTEMLWETSVGKGKVRGAVIAMLKRLGTDYIDLLYLHKPWTDVPWQEAVTQVDELIDKGFVRHFGVSNFTIDHMKEAIKLSRHPIVANELHFNVLFKNDADEKVRNFCRDNNIQIIAYRPLELGKVLQNTTVQMIAQAHKATPAQVAFAWLFHYKALIITQATDEKHINQNIDAVNLRLTANEINQLNSL